MECMYCQHQMIDTNDRSTNQFNLKTYLCPNCLAIVDVTDREDGPKERWYENDQLPDHYYKLLWKHEREKKAKQGSKDLLWFEQQIKEYGATRGSHIATINVLHLLRRTTEYQNTKKGVESS